MTFSPITPAKAIFNSDNALFSTIFNDIYCNAHSIEAQSEHTFIKANKLPGRWHNEALFTIVETGFGMGLNFLNTWKVWQQDPKKCARLHYVAIEKHPFTRKDFEKWVILLLNKSALFPFSQILARQWPELTPGFHRLTFEKGQVVLTLAFGDIVTLLPQLTLGADAFYLDGFSPSKNPEMWEPPIMKGLGRLAKINACCATHISSEIVKKRLETAGFNMQQVAGFGEQQKMLIGEFKPHWFLNYVRSATLSPKQKHAIIIGAGLAGCTVAERLASRDWDVDLYDCSSEIANGASGNPIGIFHPLIARDDNLAAQFSRAGFLYALSHWKTLPVFKKFLIKQSFEKSVRQDKTTKKISATDASLTSGLLQLAHNKDEFVAMALTLKNLAFPASFIQLISAEKANYLSGIQLSSAFGGLFFPYGGALSPRLLCKALINNKKITFHSNKYVAKLEQKNGLWSLLDKQNKIIATTSILVLANSNDATRLISSLTPISNAQSNTLKGWPLMPVRGQMTFVQNPIFNSLVLPVVKDGYICPFNKGVIVGASYEIGDTDLNWHHQSEIENFNRLSAFSEEGVKNFHQKSETPFESYIGLRCVTPDRFPIVGPVLDENLSKQQYKKNNNIKITDMPRIQGLYASLGYGSKGLTLTSLCAELLASIIENEPLPIEKNLVQATDPARFFLKQLRLS